MKKKLYPYQEMLATEGLKVIKKYGLVYYAIEMRVGKTAIAFEVAKQLGVKNVLVLTTPVNVSGQELAYNDFEYYNNFDLTVDTYHYKHIEALDSVYDLIICDESQALGAYPKPSAGASRLKELVEDSNVKIIYTTGTPSPESYSQLYHQFWIACELSPFKDWTNFYQWAKAGFVSIKLKWIGSHPQNDYSNANKHVIDKYTNKLFISYTQEAAGFKNTELEDKVVKIPTPKQLLQLINILLRDRVYVFQDDHDVIQCPTAASLRSKIHQVFSGTVIGERNSKKASFILDDYKSQYCYKAYYRKYKVVFFYIYDTEGEMLKRQFQGHWTDDQNIFNTTDKSVVYIGQVRAHARGINLSSAEVIVYINIHYSAELYIQSRRRGQVKDKQLGTQLHFLVSDASNSIEMAIYEKVQQKMPYTLEYFKQDYIKTKRG